MKKNKNIQDSKENFEITKLKKYQRKIKVKQVEQQTLLKEKKKYFRRTS
jgi:hypothetical protein